MGKMPFFRSQAENSGASYPYRALKFLQIFAYFFPCFTATFCVFLEVQFWEIFIILKSFRIRYDFRFFPPLFTGPLFFTFSKSGRAWPGREASVDAGGKKPQILQHFYKFKNLFYGLNFFYVSQKWP